MLRRMSKGVRLRAAGALVALYSLCLVVPHGLCLVVPPAALALGSTAHGVTDQSHQVAAAHVHADGAVHTHAAAADQQDPDGSTDQTGHARSCCGLACLSAIAPVIQVYSVDQVRFTAVAALIADKVAGRSPDRLYRPPISL